MSSNAFVNCFWAVATTQAGLQGLACTERGPDPMAHPGHPRSPGRCARWLVPGDCAHRSGTPFGCRSPAPGTQRHPPGLRHGRVEAMPERLSGGRALCDSQFARSTSRAT